MDDISALLAQLASPSLPGIDLGLERVQALLNALGNPEQHLPPTVHIAGTNGKGSLVAFLGAMAEAEGLKVHRYISPHLVRFHERITLAGKMVTDEALFAALMRVQALMQDIPVTFFEATTAAAFLLFAEHPADLLLLEVGMGGRLDATNCVPKPLLTAITPIGYDHQEYLGSTLSAIALEKAGILKSGVPVVVGRQVPEAFGVIASSAGLESCPMDAMGWEFRHDDEMYISKTLTLPFGTLSLHGEHQKDNAATALACAERLGFSTQAMQKGLATAKHPARMQRLTRGTLVEALPEGSELWLDGGHNPAAALTIAATLKAWQDMPTLLIVGMMADKDAKGFFAPLAGYRVATVPVEGEARSATPASLATAAQEAGCEAIACDSLVQAVEMLRKETPQRLLIAGSLYLAGNVLKDHL